MQRMLMYPPSGGYWPFLPAAFMLPPTNASLVLTGCSITTLCSTLQAYVTWMNATSPESITVSYITFASETALSVDQDMIKAISLFYPLILVYR